MGPPHLDSESEPSPRPGHVYLHETLSGASLMRWPLDARRPASARALVNAGTGGPHDLKLLPALAGLILALAPLGSACGRETEQVEPLSTRVAELEAQIGELERQLTSQAEDFQSASEAPMPSGSRLAVLKEWTGNGSLNKAHGGLLGRKSAVGHILVPGQRAVRRRPQGESVQARGLRPGGDGGQHRPGGRGQHLRIRDRDLLPQKWLRKSEQGDKWNRCLIEGMIVLSETGARDEQTTPP